MVRTLRAFRALGLGVQLMAHTTELSYVILK